MPVPAPRIALTGVPRSGTTLCCRLLGQAPDAVALFEPMPVQELPVSDRGAALDQVEAFFARCRRSLMEERRAPSQQIAGAVPDNPFGARRDAQGARTRESQLGEIHVDKPLGEGFTLVVKHNAAFAALLPGLAVRMPTVAVVRNPLATLASWNSVSLPVSRGRLPAGERLDPVLAGRLASLEDTTERQLAILDWFFDRFSTHLPPERVVRYEQVVASGGQALGDACGLAISASELAPRNASRLYDGARAQRMAERLLEQGGAWRRFYSDAQVLALARQLADGADSP